MTTALLYGDVSLNIIDGSSTWLVSLAELLTGIVDEVHVLAKVLPSEDRLAGKLRELGVVVHSEAAKPHANGLDPEAASRELERLALLTECNLVVVRGLDACFHAAQREGLRGILWSYVTDLPYPLTKAVGEGLDRLRHVAVSSRRMFAQTEAARSYLESVAPAAAGKTILMPPMIPDAAFASSGEARQTHRELRLVYAGKLAKDWRTLELLELPRALRALGVASTMTVVGDKFQRDAHDRTWADRMRSALEEASRDPSSGITWAGGVPRAEALALIAQADVGIGWRTCELDSSLEISTKALEYGAAGLAVVVNDTADHRAMFGAEYPLYSRATDAAEDLARTIAEALPSLARAREMSRRAAQPFAMTQVRANLEAALQRAGALDERKSPVRPIRVVVASHDLKFMGELLERWQSDARLEVRLDHWESLHEHSEEASLALAAWADVVVCEWAGPVLRWYSHHKRERQRLLARLHAFELRGDWLADVDFAAVDHMIFVSELYRQKAVDQLELDPAKTSVIPNAVDLADFDRPKLANSQFHLGIAGIVGFGKRPDRAVDLLARLLDEDGRYFLHVRGRNPWEYAHEWRNPLQRQLYLGFYDRIARDPVLRERVLFEPFGADMANWFRRIGVILSPSVSESFHLAPAEGMASRAVPVVWAREGAREIFGTRWLVADGGEAADSILRLRTHGEFVEAGEEARAHSQVWDGHKCFKAWGELLAPS